MSVQQKPFKSSWVDSVPAHWEQLRLGRMARIYAGGTPDKANATYWGGDIPWLNSGTVNQWMITEPSEYITEQGYEGSSARWVPKGALVMALAGQGKTKGMCAQLGIDATCNQSMAAILPDFGVSRYLLYWLSANYRNIRGMASDDLRDGLNLVLLGQIPVPVPPIDEQQAIASYLDRETARIDTLIAEKMRLIDTLREYRQATISEVVTQGLDPAASKKPSGVPWLGDVPVHWEVQRLRFRCKLNPSVRDGLSDSDVASFLPMEAVGDDGSLNLEATRPVGEVVKGYTYFEDGDVTIAKITPCFENGKGAVMRNLQGGIGFGTTELIVIRPGDEVCADWLYCFTQSDVFRKRGEAMMYGAGGQKRVPDSYVKDLPIAWPPIQEQKAIADYLDHETARIGKLLAHVQDEIKLLQELRAATITDAVTGKIQVA